MLFVELPYPGCHVSDLIVCFPEVGVREAFATYCSCGGMRPELRRTNFRCIAMPFWTVKPPLQLPQNPNRSIFTKHRENYIGCRNNYIGHRKNYIRHNFYAYNHLVTNVLWETCKMRLNSCKPAGWHKFPCKQENCNHDKAATVAILCVFTITALTANATATLMSMRTAAGMPVGRCYWKMSWLICATGKWQR